MAQHAKIVKEVYPCTVCCYINLKYCYVRQCWLFMLNYLNCLGDQCHIYYLLCALWYTAAHLQWGDRVSYAPSPIRHTMGDRIYNVRHYLRTESRQDSMKDGTPDCKWCGFEPHLALLLSLYFGLFTQEFHYFQELQFVFKTNFHPDSLS